MISMRSRRAGSPLAARACDTASFRHEPRNCRGDRFTETDDLFRPRGCRGAGLAQDPVANLLNVAGVLRQGDELSRAEQTTTGMLPSHESLEARHAGCLELHDGLVEDAELAPGHGIVKLRPELLVLLSRLIHPRLEEPGDALACMFRLVERDVRILQQNVCLDLLNGRYSNANAGSDDDLSALQQVGLAQTINNALGQALDLLKAPHGCFEDRELVASKAEL